MVNDAGGIGKEVLSLGIAALIGKAMNDPRILEALYAGKGSKEELFRVAKESCIDLTQCDLDTLTNPLIGGLTIIDLLKKAKECLKREVPDADQKWRG